MQRGENEYDLILHPNVLGLTGGTGAVTAITGNAKNWRRSSRSNGGFWQGSFTYEGTDEEKIDRFYTWLGSHLQERSSGMTTWEGMVYEMDLNYYGVRRRVSLNDVYNCVSTTYTAMAFGGDNMITNPDFDSENLNGWTEENADVDYTYYNSAPCSATVTSTGSIEDGHDAGGYLRQNVNITTGSIYQVSAYIRGGGGNALGRFGLRDPNEQDWLVRPEARGFTNAFGKAVLETAGPAGGEILVYFYAGWDSGNVAYFDDIEMLEWSPSVFETEWKYDTNSIDRTGRRELRMTSDNLPKLAADDYAETQKSLNKDPWPRALSIGSTRSVELRVHVAGYAHTANWMYSLEGDGEEGNLSDWLEEIIGTETGLSPQHGGVANNAGDCQYLSVGKIETNTLSVVNGTTIPERAWDLIMEQVHLGDSSNNIYHIGVDLGRKVVYEQVDFTPRYYIKQGEIYESIASSKPVNPWSVRPGVFRDLDYPAGAAPYDSPFEDIRDSWVDEVVVQSDGKIIPKTSQLSESDVIQAQLSAIEFEIPDPKKEPGESNLIPLIPR